MIGCYNRRISVENLSQYSLEEINQLKEDDMKKLRSFLIRLKLDFCTTFVGGDISYSEVSVALIFIPIFNVKIQ